MANNKNGGLKVHLTTVFLVSLITIVLLFSGIVGYLAYRNSLKAIDILASDIFFQTGEHLESELGHFMATPQLINALNLSLIERGFLSLDDPEALSGYFLDQIRHYPTVKSIEFANEKGEDVSVARDVFDTPLVLGFSGKNTGGDFRAFETDWSGRLGKLVWELPDFVPKENSWYKTAVEARQPTWTPIYVWPNGDLGIDAVRLVKKDGEPMGVLDTAITLNDVTDFVAKIKKSANGRVYVLDGDGLIVAGSHIPTPYIEEKNSNDEAMVRRMSPMKRFAGQLGRAASAA